MPVIDLDDDVFIRLQSLAQPLVDTPSSVVRKILDHWDRAEAKTAAEQPITRSESAPFPSLTHTKVMAATFDAQPIEKLTWDALVRSALTTAYRREGTIDGLRRVSGARVQKGRKLDEGFKYIAGQNFSYQGVSADDAIKIVYRCAQEMGCPFEVEFVWRNKEGALRPGVREKIGLSTPSGGKH